MDQDNAPDSTSIDIDDVIAVIEKTDPSTASAMFTNGGDTNAHHQMNTHQQHQQQSAQNSTINSISNLRRNAVVKITEQPASKALRFRYECEGRSAGSIPGVRSTPENKTYPGIQVVGYKGRAVVVVSCVTKDPPYRPHPHNLVGKDGCKKGVCTVEINSSNMSVTFSNLGIQCVKKKDIEDALKMREEIRVDPFRTGFAHKNQQSSIDLNAVRLCFQVFLEGEQRGRFTVPLAPVVSDPIYDKKAMSDLVICKLSDCSCPVAGGKEIILLCEKVAKEDIAVRFYEEHDGDVSWEANGDFQHTNVHKQVAIAFKTPRYKSLEIEQPIQVWIQLRRPSDGATSEPLRFDYLPLDSERDALKHKRIKFDHRIQSESGQNRMHFLNIPVDAIKPEPRETSPLNYMFQPGPYRVPQTSPSPQPPVSPVTVTSTTPQPIPIPSSSYKTNGTTVGSITPTPTPFHMDGSYLQGNNIICNNVNYVQAYAQATSFNYAQTPANNFNFQQQRTSFASTNPFNVDTLIANNNPAEAGPVKHQAVNIQLSSISQPTPMSTTEGLNSLNFSEILNELGPMSGGADLNSISLTPFETGNYSQNDNVKQEQQNRLQQEEENMTDSFTRLTTNFLNE